jgi:hypothetical protein
MKEDSIKEIYKTLKSELKKSDLEDIHEIAYDYTSREIKKIDKSFLDYYLVNIQRMLKMFSNEKVDSINKKIQNQIFLEGDNKFEGVYLDTKSLEEGNFIEKDSINLKETTDFTELIEQLSSLQKRLSN